MRNFNKKLFIPIILVVFAVGIILASFAVVRTYKTESVPASKDVQQQNEPPLAQPGWPINVQQIGTKAPVLADLYNDGKYYVIQSISTYGEPIQLYIWDQAGAPLSNEWNPKSIDGQAANSATVGDLDGNGEKEIVIVADKKIYVFCLDGTLFQGAWPVSMADIVTMPCVISDLNGDGLSEIIIGEQSNSGRLYVLDLYGEKLNDTWPKIFGSKLYDPISVGNLDSDPELEMVISIRNQSNISILNIDGTERIMALPDGYSATSFALADIDDDGQLEIVSLLFYSTDDSLYLYAWNADGSLVEGEWPVTVPLPKNAVKTKAPLCSVGDINPDIPGIEIVCATNNDGYGGVYAWDQYGNLLYRFEIQGAGFNRQAMIGDVNGDGLQEVIISDRAHKSSGIYILDYKGEIITTWYTETDNEQFQIPLVIGDIDSDEKVEVIQPCTNGRVYCWELENTGGGECMYHWPMFQQNPQHTGSFYLGTTGPIFDTIGDKEIDEGMKLQFTVNATSPEGYSLTYSVQGLPSGATFQDKIFTWIPAYNQANEYIVTFIVKDPLQGEDREAIRIKVNNLNRPPVAVAEVNNKTPKPLQEITLDGSQSYDPDGVEFGDDKIVSYRWTISARNKGPKNNDKTIGTISKLTVKAPAVIGTYVYSLYVTDTIGGKGRNSVRVTVRIRLKTRV